jgi:SAM-dependent methyltransferase
VAFARDVAEHFPVAEPVVELGARAPSGQEDEVATVRRLFGSVDYIGCDLHEGPGVDRIEDVHHLTFADASVGTILCFETLEHVADPVRAVAEMRRVVRPGGIVAISSLMFFPIHEHPSDYWRFTPQGFELLLENFESRLVLAMGYELLPEGVFGIGINGPCADLTAARLPRTKHLADSWADGLPVDFGPIRMTTRRLWGYALRYTNEAMRRRVGRRR